MQNSQSDLIKKLKAFNKKTTPIERLIAFTAIGFIIYLSAKEEQQKNINNQTNNMKNTINKLQSELSQIDQRKKDLETAIQALQNICNHEFKPDGNTHKRHEKCKLCNLVITI